MSKTNILRRLTKERVMLEGKKAKKKTKSDLDILIRKERTRIRDLKYGKYIKGAKKGSVGVRKGAKIVGRGARVIGAGLERALEAGAKTRKRTVSPIKRKKKRRVTTKAKTRTIFQVGPQGYLTPKTIKSTQKKRTKKRRKKRTTTTKREDDGMDFGGWF